MVALWEVTLDGLDLSKTNTDLKQVLEDFSCAHPIDIAVHQQEHP